MKKVLVVVSVLASLTYFASPYGLAEEAYKKYRISLTISNFSSTDEIQSDADNVSLFPRPTGGVVQVNDPRPDTAVQKSAGVRDNVRYDLQGSYGILKWRWAELTLDSGIGYFKGHLDDLEVNGQYDIDPPNPSRGQATLYHTTFVSVGDVKEIPVQVGATVRFRPKKPLSPYLAAGVGYLFASIDSSSEFDTFSYNVGHSIGAETFATGSGAFSQRAAHRLKAAEVETPDTFEWHLSGGLEYTIAKGLGLYASGAWMFARKKIDITIDGKHKLGQPVPNGIRPLQYPVGGMPVIILSQQGGLIDFASGLAFDDAGGKHHLGGPPDGTPDSGSYFAQGGTLRYSGFRFGFGVRYQF